jgi:FkbM family methyltransferase
MKSRQVILPPRFGAAALSSDTTISDQSIAVPAYLRDRGIDSVDFLTIDIDGPDFDVLNSFDRALAALNVLGVRIEVNYFGSESDTDRSLHNIDRFLKTQGFELFGLTQRRYSLAALPSRYLWNVPAESEFGRPMFGDALFLRDLGNPEHAELSARLSTGKLMNLICLFAIFDLPDCAADIALRFRDRLSTSCSVDRILDLLAVQAQGPVKKPLSYSEYVRRFDAHDRMFFHAHSEPRTEVECVPVQEEAAGRDRAALSRLSGLGWSPRVIYDVGASNGMWSESIARLYPDAEYHLFEPLAPHVAEYKERLSTVLEHCRTFALHPVALGNHGGEVIAYRFPNARASTTLPMENTESDVQSIRVPVTTLDDLIGAHGLPPPNLLKLDVQGSEFAILQGAQTILPSIDVLLLETWIWRTYEGKAPLFLEVASWLAARGFYLWDLADLDRDPSEVLQSVDCFFINAQSMAPHLTYRMYRAHVENVDTGERARLVAEVARLRADLQRLGQ